MFGVPGSKLLHPRLLRVADDWWCCWATTCAVSRSFVTEVSSLPSIYISTTIMNDGVVFGQLLS